MPRVRSQDSLGVCFGFSSATIAQHYICKEKKISNCASVPRDQEISPYAMVGWANTNKPSGGVPEPRNHSNIQFGGVGLKAIGNARNSFFFYSDSCYPFDQFANKYGTNIGAAEAVIKKLEVFYNKHKKTTGTYCEDCALQEIKKDLLASPTAEDLSYALSRDTFGEFLYQVAFGDCQDVVEHDKAPKLGYHPQKNETASIDSMVAATKQQLQSGRPVQVDGICVERSGTQCTAHHSVVVSGYRKMCKTPTDCREVFKVHNSWGQEWQDRNNDGWVDAKLLLEGVPKGGALSWYE